MRVSLLACARFPPRKPSAKMMILKPFFLIVATAAILSSAQASESLYNPQGAKSLGSSGVSLFGPRSKGVKYDTRMLRAAQIAQDRARSRSIRRCWSFVKTALLQARVVETRPETAYAKQAGEELEKDYGFRKIGITDPYAAPLGSVLVYGGKGAGHVELRTREGFVSDFKSSTPSRRPLIGVYVKPS